MGRSPAPRFCRPNRPLDPLERDEQGGRTVLGLGTSGDVEGGDGVQEVRLVDDADRLRAVEAGDAAEAGAGGAVRAATAAVSVPLRVADVRPEPDVRPDSTRACCPRQRGAGGSRHVARAVRILHPDGDARLGRARGSLATARAESADRLARRFAKAGAGDVRIDGGVPDGRTFGARLRGARCGLGSAGWARRARVGRDPTRPQDRTWRRWSRPPPPASGGR